MKQLLSPPCYAPRVVGGDVPEQDRDRGNAQDLRDARASAPSARSCSWSCGQQYTAATPTFQTSLRGSHGGEGRAGGAAVDPLSPQPLESPGIRLGVAHRVLDLLVAHVVLNQSGVVPLVHQIVAARVFEHMGMDRKP